MLTSFKFGCQSVDIHQIEMNTQTFVLCLVLISVLGANASDDEPGFNIPGGDFRITDAKGLSELTERVANSLKKLGETENGPDLKIVRVHSAIYRVVSGFTYDLETEIYENNVAVNCSISLWEKPWLDFEKLDVTCGKENPRKYQWLSRDDPDLIPLDDSFNELSSKELSKLELKLKPAFTQLSIENKEFDLNMKRIVSGKSKFEQGTKYEVNIDATNKSNEIKKCTALIFEKVLEDYFKVDLTCDDKSYSFLKQKS